MKLLISSISILVIVIFGFGYFATKYEPVQDVILPTPSATTTLSASPTEGGAPLTVTFNARVEVPADTRGNTLIFFGDGVSDIVGRRSQTVFSDSWTHTYTKGGEYTVSLVRTTESNVDADISVLMSPIYFKNTILKELRIKVQPASTQEATQPFLVRPFVGTPSLQNSIHPAKGDWIIISADGPDMSVDLTGWIVRSAQSGASVTIVPPSGIQKVTIGSRDTAVFIHTVGSPSKSYVAEGEWHLYFGQENVLWGAEHDSIQLVDPTGKIISTYSY
jgi:PKD repeat protein